MAWLEPEIKMSEKGKLPRKRIILQKERKNGQTQMFNMRKKIELNVLWNFMQSHAVYRKEGTNGVP